MYNTITLFIYLYFNLVPEPLLPLSRGKLHLSIQGLGDFQFKTQFFGMGRIYQIHDSLYRWPLETENRFSPEASRKSISLPIP